MIKIFELVFILIIILDSINSELQPTSKSEGNEPYLPNVITSVKECSLRHYRWGKRTLVAPVSGVEAFLREFPHIAAIGWTINGTTVWNCGGSLITVNFILTAGHCTSWERNPPDTVRLGDLNLNSGHDDKYAQQHDIDEVIRHPEYKFSSSYDDIALLRLKTSVTIHNTVMPVCLWPTFDFNFEAMEAAGWGLTSYGGKKAEKLLKVFLNSVPNEVCKESYPKNRKRKNGLIESQMCAESKAKVVMDTCEGDSGGPLEIKLYGQAKLIPFLVGITSFGAGCASGSPGVYTRVSSYIKWVESITQETFDPIKCALRNIDLRLFEPSFYGEGIQYDDGTGNFESTILYVDSSKFFVGTFSMIYTVMLTSKTTDKDVTCSGSIIDESYILTSASCIKKFSNGPDTVIYKIETWSASSTETFDIKKVFVHPKYDNTYNDIALVQLTEKIRFNQEGQLACVGSTYQLPDRLDASGFGPANINLNGNSFDIKHLSIKFNVTDANTCNSKVQKVFKSFRGIQDSQLCASLPYFVVPTSCETDSGGPLQRQLWDVSRYFPFVFGVNSFGVDCGFGIPLVTSRVGSFIPWIDSIVYPNPKSLGRKEPEIEEHFQECVSKNLPFREDYSDLNNNRQYQQNQTRLSTMALVEHFSEETKQQTWSCDAVIVHYKFVITTARCATATKVARVLVSIAKGPITLGVVRTYVHPKYNPANGANDVALLETEKYIKFDENVSPACLWYNQTHLPMFLSKPLASGNAMADVSHISMFPITNMDCTEDHDSLTSAQFCAIPDIKCKYADGTEATTICSSANCPRNHGEVSMTFEITQKKMSPILVGFASTTNYCDLEKPLVFTRISIYRDWIERTLHFSDEFLVFND